MISRSAICSWKGQERISVPGGVGYRFSIFFSCQTITQALGTGNPRQRFEFTESDAVIDFQMKGGEIVISASYAPGEIRSGLAEFQRHVTRFGQRLTRDLLAKYPELAENEWFKTRVLDR